MAQYYVDNTPFAGHGTGTAQAGTSGTITLAATCPAATNALTNYGIHIVSGTGARQSRRITAYDTDTKIATVHTGWNTPPDATSVYDITVGCDSNNGLAQGLYGGTNGAFASMQAALSNTSLAAGDTIWVKAGTSYTWSNSSSYHATISKAGTATLPIVLEGYKDTPGDADTHRDDDAYRATIDGNRLSLANGLGNTLSSSAIYYKIRHLRARRCSGYGIATGQSSSYALLDNCRCENNGNQGARIGISCVVIGGEYDNNAGHGLFVTTNTIVMMATAHGNSENQISVEGAGGLVAFCEAYGIPANKAGIKCLYQCHVVNCTVDGENANSIGINMAGDRSSVVNCIVTRCGIGLLGPTGNAFIDSRYNLLHRNSTDTSNWPVGTGHITGQDPLFTDADNHDYRVGSGSPARGAGTPAHIDIGANQREEPTASSGGGSPTNKGMQL